ncbi:hypothetical protein HDU97_004710 [Phlyctochytrium planicorne]|nr:hypothetical protein HDU97_004710 [Phlyctochytrium planicorne]
MARNSLFAAAMLIFLAMPRASLQQQNSSAAGPSDITSISISKGVYYISDSNSRFWLSNDKGSSWTSIDGTGPWAILGVKSGKVSGNSRGDLWFISPQSVLFSVRGTSVDQDGLPAGSYDAVDLSVRDRVYLVTRDLRTCSRPLEVQQRNYYCNSEIQALAIAASSKTVFVISTNGTLYSAPILQNDRNLFFTDTGFKTKSQRDLVVPIDDDFPVLINSYGQIQVITCTDSDKVCSSPELPPPPPTSSFSNSSTQQTITTTTSPQTFVTSISTSLQALQASSNSELLIPPSLSNPTQPPVSKQNSPSPNTIPNPLPTTLPTQNGPTEESYQNLLSGGSSLVILVSTFGSLLLLVILAMASIIIQRTVRAENRLDEIAVFVRESNKKMSQRRQYRRLRVIAENNTVGEVEPLQASFADDRGGQEVDTGNGRLEGVGGPPGYAEA